MPLSYTLIRPIFAFSEETGTALKIPCGEVIIMIAEPGRSGITAGSWRGRKILIFRDDAEQNGLRVEGCGGTG